MTEQGAAIIPFPRSPLPAPAAAPAALAAPMARLAAALAALDSALAAQRDAVSGWRRALGDLGVGVDSLHRSLLGYQARLSELGDRVDSLNVTARRLDRWAGGVLAREGENAAGHGEEPRPAAGSRG